MSASLTATVAYTYSTHYVTDPDTGAPRRQVEAWPTGGFTIDPATLELQPRPVLRRKSDEHTTANERRAARNAWRQREAHQLIAAVETLIALAPQIAERMRQLDTANQLDEGADHEKQ